jgi:hypothetical protein
MFVNAESVATWASYVEAPSTLAQVRVGLVEIFVPLFFGDTSFGFERDRQTLIPAGSEAVLLLSSDSRMTFVGSTMAPIK